ncbi:hypothetical protein NA57DRAFT_74672 [Rhizodiscina lignyota]|uniref:Uncharacterized protein n=1 Tax=Rhizodiscina lignyota TaxID=1504668 RepID=A0A9P4M7V5_9PEZI|nr:hypothetical protein NA57DRAFT_74672 [Rhizodiscina lignyota]
MGNWTNMGCNGMTGYQGQLTIQTALDIARNSEGEVEPTISAFLEHALQVVWAKLISAPDAYILTKDEFALFNYFRPRFAHSDLAQKAVRRFWEHYRGTEGYSTS